MYRGLDNPGPVETSLAGSESVLGGSLSFGGFLVCGFGAELTDGFLKPGSSSILMAPFNVKMDQKGHIIGDICDILINGSDVLNSWS